MRFFIATEPPTATAQEKKVAVVKGRPIFYDPPAVKAAKQVLVAKLKPHKSAHHRPNYSD